MTLQKISNKSNKKLLKLINNYRQCCKIQTSTELLFTSNEPLEFKIKNATIQHTMHITTNGRKEGKGWKERKNKKEKERKRGGREKEREEEKKKEGGVRLKEKKKGRKERKEK